MSAYDGQVSNSDLDAFKNPKDIRTGSVTLSGTVGSNGAWEETVTFTDIDNPDLGQIFFDNSLYHSGVFKDAKLELATTIRDTTTPSYLIADLWVKINGNNITLGATAFNTYGYSVTITPVTINFRYIPYQGTF